MKPYTIKSVSELHRLLALPKPRHPLVSVIDFSSIRCFDDDRLETVTYGFYCVSLKKNFNAKMRYGQQEYDFDGGVMSFFSPGQVIMTEIRNDWDLQGQWLVIHPDFLQGFGLCSEIHQFGFFSYTTNEALHLSEEEELAMGGLLSNIEMESHRIIDHFSQTIIIKQIELLLHYCERFYYRQFLTRKQGNSGHLGNFERLLEDYFNSGMAAFNGIPEISYFADKLNLSRYYLSDMLRNTTGRSAQQHIQDKVMEKAKELLSNSQLSVSEIAYQLGFEYPQSFHKMFRNRLSLSPMDYRTKFVNN